MNKLIPVLLLCLFAAATTTYAERINSREFHFQLTTPDNMKEVRDTLSLVPGNLYLDTSAGVVLIISGRESKFRSVTDYIDCTHEKLEQELRVDYGDTSLTLISCNRSAFYPEKSTLLHFMISVDSWYNTYLIYFVHYKGRDIQLSFAYRRDQEQASVAYVNKIMETFKLQ